MIFNTKKNFSYKLSIYINPAWNQYYKKLYAPKSEAGWDKHLSGRIKKRDMRNDLWGRGYSFTEYYNSASGLVSKFQTIYHATGSQALNAVDDFGDRGYIFDADLYLGSDKKKDEESNRLAVEITEGSILTNIFDPYMGGPRVGYEKKDYLFTFPLFEVFNFLFSLGQRFHGTEDNFIIKWPEYIEKKFKEYGIEYNSLRDHDPTTEFNIEEHDKEFFEKFGRPRVALFGRSNDSYFSDKDKTHYQVSLKIFRPDENDRIDESGLFLDKK